MSIISITPDRTRPIVVRGVTYYPDQEQTVYFDDIGVVEMYAPCIRAGLDPDYNGHHTIYNLSIDTDTSPNCPSDIERLALQYTCGLKQDEPEPRYHNSIAVDGRTYVFCVHEQWPQDHIEVDGDQASTYQYAVCMEDEPNALTKERSIYCITWSGHFDYNNADVRPDSRYRARID